jgi:hypothetical protein
MMAGVDGRIELPRFIRQLDARRRNDGISGAEKNMEMRTSILIISAASLVALGGIARADDHLFNAEQPGLGLSVDSNAFDHAQAFAHEEVPGQGSPFVGNEPHQTPASSVAQEKPNANINPKSH